MSPPVVRKHVETLLAAALEDREAETVLLAGMLFDDYGSVVRQPYSAHSITVAQAERRGGWAELLAEVEGEDTIFRPGRAQVIDLVECLRELAVPATERGNLRRLLIEAHRPHAAGDFSTAHRLALADVRDRQAEPPATFEKCVDGLLRRDIDHIRTTFSFVEWYCRYLAEVDLNHAAAADLRAACRAALPVGGFDLARLDRLCEDIRGRELGRRPHVVFRLEDKTVGGWSVWRYPGGIIGTQPGNVRPHGTSQGGSDQPVESSEQLAAAVQEMLTKLPDFQPTEPQHHSPAPPVIEFMGADWEWLDAKIEDVPVTPGVTLGRLAPVVVRLPQDEDTSPVAYRRWEHAHNGGAAKIQFLTGEDQAIGDKSPALAICYRPADMCATLRRIRAAGVRIAAWSRGETDVTNFVNGHQLTDLIDVLWNRRRAGTCADVVLLWDDPHWTFTGNRLAWRPA